ncbi:hypothetical protein [uncultured Croceitalea sp.]|uniref:hypothetical protein n=1 Tax=uncultured Croceitalea sp. TaxID=1798908 RepID=UPI00374FA563
MVVLKKLKASTLMETMVATVLIVVLFMIASLVMNSLVATQAERDQGGIEARIRQLEYFYISDKIELPYVEEWQQWEIEVSSQKEGALDLVKFTAIEPNTGQKYGSSIPEKK